MSFDPVQRFLGIERDASPAELLGFSEPPPSALAVEEALHRRLAEVYNHPEGRTSDAEEVRRILRQAATDLKATLPRSSTHVPPRILERARPQALTPFDRNVLAVLVGSGGWNAASRARLIAMASTHNVTGPGLLKVIAGLARWSAAGHRLPTLEGPRRTVGASAPVNRQPERSAASAAEEETSSAWRTFKLSVLFGSIASAVAIVAMIQIAPRIDPVQPAPIAAPAQPVPAQPASEEDLETTESPEPPARPSEHIDWGIARFDNAPWPTVHAPIPEAAVTASRGVDDLADDLDNVIVRINIAADQELAEIVFRIWQDVTSQVATGWVLLEDGTLRSIERLLVDALFTSAGRSKEATTERLLSLLAPPSAATVDTAEPLDLWRGAWRAGTLARIAFHPDLPTGIVDIARARLNASLNRRAGDDTRLNFTQAAVAWLDLAMPSLIRNINEDERAVVAWEMWITAHKRLGPNERVGGTMIAAIGSLLAAQPSLLDGDAPTPALAMLRRLLQEADFNTNPRVHDRFLALLDDDRIESKDLWLLTSLLAHSAHAGWFDESFVLRNPEPSVRRRLRQDVGRAWPAAALARGEEGRFRRSEIDPVAGERWLRLTERLDDAAIEMDQPELMLAQIVRLAQIGEAAAYLVAHTPARAERLLDAIESPAGTSPPAQREPQRGRAIGTEGGWATAYDEARRDLEERIRLLRALQANAGGDLWPAEAAILVREAYRSSQSEIRTVAQNIITATFARGPNVARELLDQLPDVHRTPAISEFLSKYTGHSLPAQRGDDWTISVRLALIEHLLSLLLGDAPVIERIADDLGATYAAQAAALSDDEAPTNADVPGTPSAGAATLFDLWRLRAHRYAASRLGEELASIERRHAARLRLAESPIQETIALRIGTLEMMALTTKGEAAPVASPEGRAEGGGLDRRMAYIFETHSEKWRDAPNALLQALWVERAINAVWRARIDVPDEVAQSGYIPGSGPPQRRAMTAASLAPVLLRISSLLLAPASLRPVTDDRWAAQLEALDPADPMAYFELAEEIADEASTDAMRALAERLFALAGALDPQRLGPSACLALADLAQDRFAKRRLLVLADLLGREGAEHAHLLRTNGAEQSPERRAAALAVSEAFSHFRMGNGTRAAQVLRRDEVMAMLESVESALPWRSARTFLNEAAAQRRRPSITDSALLRLLQVEQYLLGGNGDGGSRAWATELTFTGGRPLIEVDPARLDEALGVDLARPYFRSGAWVAQP